MGSSVKATFPILFLSLLIPASLPADTGTASAKDEITGRHHQSGVSVAVAQECRAVEKMMATRFTLHKTEHFVLIHRDSDPSVSPVSQTGELLEQTHRHFYESCAAAGIRLQPLKKHLIWVSFNQRGDFDRYTRQADRMDLSWLDGYYSARTNRVALAPRKSQPQALPDDNIQQIATAPEISGFQSADSSSNVETLIDRNRASHEAAHQLAFNSGLQTRGVMYPIWISEGLATHFEADGDTEFGLGRANPVRARHLAKAHRKGQLMPLDEFLVLTRVPADDIPAANVLYAQAWGMIQFLLKEKPQALQHYLRQLAGTEIGWRSESQLRREIIHAFGSVNRLERSWNDFLDALPY